jgi:hypothetical protein
VRAGCRGRELRALRAHADIELRRARAPRQDLHHAAYRLTAVQRRVVAAHDFDALDLIERQVLPGRGTEVGAREGHAIDQHQRLAAVGAAQEQRGLRTQGPGLGDVDAGQLAQERR